MLSSLKNICAFNVLPLRTFLFVVNILASHSQYQLFIFFQEKKKQACKNCFIHMFYLCVWFFATCYKSYHHLCHQGASRMRGRLGSMGSLSSFERVSFLDNKHENSQSFGHGIMLQLCSEEKKNMMDMFSLRSVLVFVL